MGCENYRRLYMVPEMLPLLGGRQLGVGDSVTCQAHLPGCGPPSGSAVVVKTRGKCVNSLPRAAHSQHAHKSGTAS